MGGLLVFRLSSRIRTSPLCDARSKSAMACANFPNGSVAHWRKHRFRILFATDSNLAALRRRSKSAMACAKFLNALVEYWRKHRLRILFATDSHSPLYNPLNICYNTLIIHTGGSHDTSL